MNRIIKSDRQSLNKNPVKRNVRSGLSSGAKISWLDTTKCAVLLGIITFCIYANTLQNGYTFDDVAAIKINSLVTKGIAAIPEIMVTPYHHGDHNVGGSIALRDDQYRPLSLIMFAIEYQLFPNNPIPGHLINVLLYIFCVILLFFFVYNLFEKTRIVLAFTAAFLFAIHPIHTEVVANIKSRDEILCFLFMFLSLNAFLRYIDNTKVKFLIVGLTFYFFSLLSKETSITFIAIIPFIFFLYKNENKRRSVNIFLASLTVVIVYLFIRFSVLATFNAYHPSLVSFFENALVAAPSSASRLATEILVLGLYIKLLIVPYPLICDYSFNSVPFANFSHASPWVSLGAYILILGVGIYRLVKNRKDPIPFGIAFFLVTVSIFSNILFLLQAEMAERFMFFPSVGFCVVAGFGVEKLWLNSETKHIARSGGIGVFTFTKAGVILGGVVVSILFAEICIQRNKEWQDNFTLFVTDSKKSPDNCRLRYFAGKEKIDRSNREDPNSGIKQAMNKEGVADMYKCLAIYPNFSDALDELAYYHLIALRFDSAEAYCKKALMSSPNDVSAMNNLAIIYTSQRKYLEAVAMDRKASLIDPSNSYYPGNIGVCYVYSAHYDSAIYYLRKSIDRDASNTRYMKFFAISFNATGQRDSARKYETLVKQSEPDFSVNVPVLPL